MNTKGNNKRYISAKKLSEALGVHLATAYRIMKRFNLVKIGRKKFLEFSKDFWQYILNEYRKFKKLGNEAKKEIILRIRLNSKLNVTTKKKKGEKQNDLEELNKKILKLENEKQQLINQLNMQKEKYKREIDGLSLDVRYSKERIENLEKENEDLIEGKLQNRKVYTVSCEPVKQEVIPHYSAFFKRVE